MPRKPKSESEAPSELPTIPEELINQVVKGPTTADTVKAGSMAFKKALIE